MAHMLFGCKLVGLINRDDSPMFNWGWANGSINEDWGFLTFGFWQRGARERQKFGLAWLVAAA